MSRPPGATSGGDGPRATRGAGFAAAKGALLIGLAIVIGVVLLQQVDDSKGGTSAATTATTKPKPKTTTTRPKAPTTTIAAEPTKTPAELHIIVLNGGGPAGAAGRMSTQLKQAKYTNQPADANNWSGHSQQGNTVLCKAGLDREAVTLSVAVGEGTQVQPFPTPPPPYSNDVSCVVVVGRGASAATTTTTAAAASS